MFKSYVKITWRTMSRQKVFILINVFGLSIAIACCIVAYSNYDFNARFDSNHLNAATLYRVNSLREFENQITEFGHVPLPLGDAIRQNAGDVKKVIRYSPERANLRIGDEIFESGLSYVDADFFKAFTFEFKEGNVNSLNNKSLIIINETLALTLFGEQPALGKQVTQLLPDDKLREFTVGGVFKLPPANSSFNDDAFAHFDNYLDITPEAARGTNWSYRTTLFVEVDNPTRLRAIEDQLKPFAVANNLAREDFVIKGFRLDAFDGMALRDKDADRQGTWTRDVISGAAVVGSVIMSTLILLIACFNLTNTAISVSSRRLKEIGIRKVMGGVRFQLILQFMGETLLICLVSLLLGMLIANVYLLPAFNSLWPYMKLTTHYTDQPEFLIFMLILLVCTGLLAGSYPALYISRFQPIAILKGRLRFGGTSFFTRMLLTLQYAFSLIAIVCSVAFLGNAKYQRNIDPGFDQKGVVYTRLENGNEFETYRNALIGNAEIVSIAGSKDHIFSSAYNGTIKSDGKMMDVEMMDVGDGYLGTVGMQLAAGRDFLKDSDTDYKESVIISEKLASRMGWDRPLGQEILWKDSVRVYVIGVVKNAYTYGLWREMPPMMIRFIPQKKYTHLIVSAAPEHLVSVNQFMEMKWKETFPNRLYRAHYMEDGMAEAVQANDNIVRTFAFLGIVAMLLSATGLFTLVSLNILNKTKEIGIRKVFGASVTHIAAVVNREFVIILLIASVLGAAAGTTYSMVLMSLIWKYYQPISALAIGASVGVMILTSALAVGFKIYATARMNPVVILRDE